MTDQKIKIEKYQPSNASEGMAFFDAWCCKCDRDRSMRDGIDTEECSDNDLCPIIVATMIYSVDDQRYPEVSE